MANSLAPQVVNGPARVAAPYGLFSVLDFREPADSHWEAGGVTWKSFSGEDPLGTVGAVQTNPEDIDGLPKTFTGDISTDAAGVFTVYGHQKVTPGAWSQGAASERARAHLTALEERTVEAVLSGELALLTSPMSAAFPFAAANDMVDVISLLEGFLAVNYGSRGVIHLSRANAIIALSRDAALETRGNGLYTKLGTPVVAGSGYPDDAAWATSALVAYRSDVFDNTTRPYDLLDKLHNDLYAIAERTYCIGYEASALGEVTIGDSPA